MISGWKILVMFQKGLREIYLDEKKVSCIPAQPEGSCHKVRVVMG